MDTRRHLRVTDLEWDGRRDYGGGPGVHGAQRWTRNGMEWDGMKSMLN
jgi:hypothetical protein